MEEEVVTVFGGTGFLGRRIVQQLLAADCQVRVAARYPNTVDFPGRQTRTVPMATDIRDEKAVAEAVSGATAVVNAVSLYREKGALSFDVVHVQGAERVARCARAAGVRRLVHVSGIGVDRNSRSRFVRARALGERAVRDAFGQASIVRPSVMFARDEGFLEALQMAARLPIVPLFGRGETRLQPAWVDDVASAISVLLRSDAYQGSLFELGGAGVVTYREALRLVLAHTGRRRWMLPVPFPLWRIGVAGLNILPNPPLTRDQLILMEHDNVVGSGAKTFADLSIQPASLESYLAAQVRQPPDRTS